MPFHDGLYRHLLGEIPEAPILVTINEALANAGHDVIPSLDALLAFLHGEGTRDYHVIDLIYRTALEGFEGGAEPMWRSFLLAAMLPGLEHLHFSLRHTTPFKHGLWEEVLFAFSESLSGLPPSQQTSHIPYNLLLDVRKRVRKHLDERRLRSDQEVSLNEMEWDPPSEPNHAAVLLQLLFEKAVREGVVSLADCSLVIATELHGLTCAEVAKTEGVPETAIRQRKSRALKKLRTFVAKRKA